MRLSEREPEYHTRNKQVVQRADEVRMAVDMISALGAGQALNNVMPQEKGYNLDAFKGKCFLWF
jgi:hypothetical protein